MTRWRCFIVSRKVRLCVNFILPWERKILKEKKSPPKSSCHAPGLGFIIYTFFSVHRQCVWQELCPCVNTIGDDDDDYLWRFLGYFCHSSWCYWVTSLFFFKDREKDSRMLFSVFLNQPFQPADVRDLHFLNCSFKRNECTFYVLIVFNNVYFIIIRLSLMLPNLCSNLM